MKSLSIAATGMLAQQLNVEVISNNIANMNTTGFKRQRAEFQDLLYQNLERMGAAPRIPARSCRPAFRSAPASRRARSTASPSRATCIEHGQPLRPRDPGQGLFPHSSCRTASDGLYARRLLRALARRPDRHRRRLSSWRRASPFRRTRSRHDQRRRARSQAQIAGQIAAAESWASSSSRPSRTRPASKAIGDNLFLRNRGLGRADHRRRPARRASARCSRASSRPRTSIAVAEITA